MDRVLQGLCLCLQVEIASAERLAERAGLLDGQRRAALAELEGRRSGDREAAGALLCELEGRTAAEDALERAVAEREASLKQVRPAACKAACSNRFVCRRNRNSAAEVRAL